MSQQFLSMCTRKPSVSWWSTRSGAKDCWGHRNRAWAFAAIRSSKTMAKTPSYNIHSKGPWMCVRMCAYVYGGVLTCACRCEGQWLTSVPFSINLHLRLWGRGFHPLWSSFGQSKSPGSICLSPTPKPGLHRLTLLNPAFHIGAVEPNPGSWACQAVTLSMEPSL